MERAEHCFRHHTDAASTLATWGEDALAHWVAAEFEARRISVERYHLCFDEYGRTSAVAGEAEIYAEAQRRNPFGAMEANFGSLPDGRWVTWVTLIAVTIFFVTEKKERAEERYKLMVRLMDEVAEANGE